MRGTTASLPPASTQVAFASFHVEPHSLYTPKYLVRAWCATRACVAYIHACVVSRRGAHKHTCYPLWPSAGAKDGAEVGAKVGTWVKLVV